MLSQVGWFGSRELAGFRAGHDPVERLRMAQSASRPATLDTPTLRRLRGAAKPGTLALLDGCHIHALDRADGQWRIGLHRAGSLLLGSNALGVPEATSTGASASSQHAGTAQAASGVPRGNKADGRDEVFADAVWLATGTAVDVLADPVLRQLQSSCPTRIMGGYPVLDDSSLAWPGLPLFLLGRSALLTVGPAAGAPACMHAVNNCPMLNRACALVFQMSCRSEFSTFAMKDVQCMALLVQ